MSKSTLTINDGKCQIVFGKLTFSRKFEDIKDWCFVFLENLKIFLYFCLIIDGHAKNKCNFCQKNFGRLKFSGLD